MRSQLVAPALALVAEAGGDVAGLIRRFALPPTAATDAEVVLPLGMLHGFLDAAEVEARDPVLGLHLAARLPRGAYGVVEFSSRSAATIRDALIRIVRYIGLVAELVTVTFDEHDGVGVVEHRIAGEPRCVGRHGNECFLAMLLTRARQLSGAAWNPERVWFAHPRPADTTALEAVLGTTQVRFDAGANGVALPAAVLDLPLASSDPPLLSLLDRHADQALAGRPAAPPLLTLVRRRVRETLAETPPTLEDVAAALHMGARTLQRRLADENISFQQLVDELRHELALDLVKDPRRPLGEIAFLLGYAELSPFLRAFKRWTGKSPGDLRAVAPGQS